MIKLKFFSCYFKHANKSMGQTLSVELKQYVETIKPSIESIVKGRLNESYKMIDYDGVLFIRVSNTDERKYIGIKFTFYSVTCKIQYMLCENNQKNQRKLKTLENVVLQNVPSALDALLEEMGHHIITQLW